MSKFRDELKVEIGNMSDIPVEDNNEEEEKLYIEYKKKRYEQKKKQMELHRELVNEMRIDKGEYER